MRARSGSISRRLGANSRRCLTAAFAAGDSRLLHRRACGGVVEPRALRWRALRAACSIPAKASRHVRGDTLRRIRARGHAYASCSARTCCPPAITTRTTGRRRQCARSSRAISTRVFASGVHALFTPTTPTTAFPIGAITRSVRDVSERHLHCDGEPRRRAGDVASDWSRRRIFRLADRSSRLISTKRRCSASPTLSKQALGRRRRTR